MIHDDRMLNFNDGGAVEPINPVYPFNCYRKCSREKRVKNKLSPPYRVLTYMVLFNETITQLQ